MVLCPAGHKVDFLSGSHLGVGDVRAIVCLGRFTAALRSGLVAGGGLRGIRSPRNQAGAKMVAYDFQRDAKGSPKWVGLLVPLDKGITHLHNAFMCGFWFSEDTAPVESDCSLPHFVYENIETSTRS